MPRSTRRWPGTSAAAVATRGSGGPCIGPLDWPTAAAARTIVPGQEPDRWGPPEPGQPHYRPDAPWDLTPPADCDWFGALGDGLVVVLEPPEPDAARTTARGAWMHLAGDGLVTAFTGKVDVGQDNRTALRLLVAEELGVPVDRVRLAMGDTDVCPHDLGTFGSRSMPDAGRALRIVAAYARGLSPAAPGDRRIELVDRRAGVCRTRRAGGRPGDPARPGHRVAP